MHKKHSVKMILAFSISVFVIVSLTTLLVGSAMYYLIKHDYLRGYSHLAVIGVLCLSSIFISTIVAHSLGKWLFSSFAVLNKATKEVAQGDFSIRIEEDNWIDEVAGLSQNFNIMVSELGKIDNMRQEFIANISHELKTPIAAIDGYASLLKTPGLSEEKKADYIERIVVSARRLNSLSSDILYMSKLDNQEIKEKETFFSLSEEIRQVLLLLETCWSEKEIELDIEIEDIEIVGNKELLQHVWQNILSNAIKFSDKGGKITVCLKKNSDKITFLVKDEGCGMTLSEIERATEKFYQGDSSRSNQGAGLGLAMVSRIVELVEGRMAIESEKNQGTIVRIELYESKHLP
ncbi:HAMP domain-containing histidine kinase [Vagococcus sp. PNs007]|uniref:Heme sensor protein HssS n=1 Tax=Vagococcus proximus TaxID=2991417 RepID=A0ABT5X285_9ENTE|nr:HAMP domain-containing sensor histidine kinase [Vagococcus proximus]MDF0480011.1 HAMP domain-containing histidine kinase [Vagococcus proximus]